MRLSESEIQSMVEMELSTMTLFSVCVNNRFTKLICPEGRIASRYAFYFMDPSEEKEYEKTKRSVLLKAGSQKAFHAFIFALAFRGEDQRVHESILSLIDEGLDVRVIEAAGAGMEQEIRERYARNMVYYSLAGSKHNPDAAEHIDRAYGELKPWTEKLLSSPVTVYDKGHPEGAAYETLSSFYDQVLRENCEKYSCSPDTMDLDGFFFRNIGARYHVKDGYYGQILSPWEITDPERTPERLFDFVWGNDGAWYDPRYAGEKIVILKKAFDAFIEDRLKREEKVSFREIFEALREPPYGLLPNTIGAILMGMFFRTWRDRGLIWTNGFQQDVLDDAHMLAMIENGVHNQQTYYRNSLADTIMLPDRRTSVLMDAAADIFSLDREAVRFLPGLRSELRSAMEALPYPILCAQYADLCDPDWETIEDLIRFARLTSDSADEAYEDLVNRLSSAFQGDAGLKERIKGALYGDSLRKGFFGMLEKNGMDPAAVTAEKLGRICCGHREWKWIWQEESILSEIRGMK